MILKIFELSKHIPPFIEVMTKVVTIWGFLNFTNKVILQSDISVANSALDRLPTLRIAFNSILNKQSYNLIEHNEKIAETYRKLYIDLKQLGLTNKYNNIKSDCANILKEQFAYLSIQNKDKQIKESQLLRIEIERKISNLLKKLDELEKDLMSIFDMSFKRQYFISYLSKSIFEVISFSLIVYLIQINNIYSALLLFLGIFIFYVYFYIKQFASYRY